jgi:anti-sigma-K factor RskA
VTCDEFQDQAAAYALGALESEEARACDRHLGERSHQRDCDRVARRMRATVVALADSLPSVRPSPGVWRAIEARLGLAAPTRRALPLALAAGVALAAIAAWQLERASAHRDLEARQRELTALAGAAAEGREVADLLAEPGSRVVPLAPVPGGGGRAAAVVNLAARRAVVVTSALAPQAGKDYQLWVIRGTAAPVPAGFLRFAAGNAAAASGQIDPALLTGAPPDALAVSLEPAGGSRSPTQVLLVGKLGT